MSTRYDIAVVGSGYAGSIAAMIARRLGRSVILLERGTHPRVVIGESSTPLSNLLLEEIAMRYDLPQLQPLTKWGRWQQSYPEIACGLKRGFSFLHHKLGRPSDGSIAAERQMLVGASPSDAIADTHWYRADVDQMLVRQAQEIGVEYVDRFTIRDMVRDADGWTLRGAEKSRARAVQARFVIDASGPRGFLHQALGLEERALPGYPATSALYSHFTGVSEMGAASESFAQAPYPVDAAALHHVFPGGWVWVLRFNNGVTSAGAAVRAETAARFGFAQKEQAWGRLLCALPEVREQFVHARATMPFTYLPSIASRTAQVAGADWAMLPSAAGFVDPLFSTGFPLTLLGIGRLMEAFQRDWASPRLASSLAHYAEQTDAELVATGRLIGSLYRSMDDFATFRCLSLLYFAAATYSEVVRRLERPELAGGFLLHNHPVYGPASQRILESMHDAMAPAEKLTLCEAVYRLIEEFDVAGLCKRPQNHCYPVDVDDLFAGASRLGASAAEIDCMLRRSGFYGAETAN